MLTPQENLFNFLKEKNLTRFNSYEDFQKGNPRNTDLIPQELRNNHAEETQLKRIGIDLEVVAQKQQTKAEKRKEAYNAWKDNMEKQERSDFNYAFNEDD